MLAARLVAPVVVVAASQVLLGLAGALAAAAWGWPTGSALPAWVFVAQIVAFGGTCAYLLASARSDRRIASLAVIFALVAASFARVPLGALERAADSPAALVALRSARVDAWLPLFVWDFFGAFPRSIDSQRVRLGVRAAIAASASVGALLFAVNLLLPWLPDAPGALRTLDVANPESPYWALVYGAMLPALPVALWRTRTAGRDERRRSAIFAAGVVAAAVPVTLYVMAMGSWPAFAHWFERGGRSLVLPIVELLIVSIPLTTAYAVLVDRVLPVRVLLRAAVRHRLAGWVASTAAALPFVWIAWYAWRLRDETLRHALSNERALVLVSVLAVGVLTTRARSRARDAIDRTFFRERYDSRTLLRHVAERCQHVERVADLADLLCEELDRALHLESIDVYVVDPVSGALRCARGRGRTLDASPAFVRTLERAQAAVDVDLERAASPLRALRESDRHWLADGGYVLLLPLRSSSRELLGLVALGEKKSELPFTAEDRQLLDTIGAAGALTLASRLRLDSGAFAPTASPADASVETDAAGPARLCSVCGRILDGSRPVCRCPDGESVLAPVPEVLFGKFVLERRVGQGSMGVVFRAFDRSLERTVALKTLPATSPEEGLRLRREARAMAAAVHPNLALIYSAESWKGTPILVTEFLAGGSLADRIAQGPIPAEVVADLGGRLAAAVERLHAAGILHRDIKPSNIGFDDAGTVKLLDFGLARIVESHATDASRESLVPVVGSPERLARSSTLLEGIVGTPLYMSPQALAGDPPDARFDLWSLAVVLHEALAGSHPFEQASWAATVEAIQHARPADLRARAPDCPEPILAFLADALHPELRRRPQTAREFRDRWARASSAALASAA